MLEHNLADIYQAGELGKAIREFISVGGQFGFIEGNKYTFHRLWNKMVPEVPADAPERPTGSGPEVHNLKTFFRLFERDDLVRLHDYFRDRPADVPTAAEALDITESTAYNYVEELVDADLLVERGEGLNGAELYEAVDWSITITVDGKDLSLGPLTASIHANRTRLRGIEELIDERGIAFLQAFVEGARAYHKGQTTTRQLAADFDLSYGLTIEALVGIGEFFGYESADEPLTSEDAPDDPIVGDEIDLRELEPRDTSTEGENEAPGEPIGLMERKRQSDGDEQ